MSRIPTAEEFLDNKLENATSYGEESIKQWLVEFTRFHVEAALKAASENAEIRTEEIGGGLNIEWKEIDKNSILNAYPLENVK